MRARPPLHALTWLVLVLGLAVVGTLTWLSWRSYQDNEKHLLDLKGKEIASVLMASLPTVQTPLAGAAELANVSGGSPQQFKEFVTPYVGPAGRFVSASLWRLGAPEAGPVVVVGEPPTIAAQPAEAAGFFARADQSEPLNVTGILPGPTLRLGYAYHLGRSAPYVAYAEVALPADRRARVAQNSAFADLHYALYLGRSAQPAALLATDLTHLPVVGRHAVAMVPFGDSAFTMVITPRGTLSGALSRRLPWIVAIFGTLLAVAATVVAEWLFRRRRRAEDLALALDEAMRDQDRLYAEQRSIAQTLQQALLPESLPHVEGLAVSCRYVAGTHGMEIGGDWYDLIPLDRGRSLFVVGDVSGRGVDAAAVMARLRYALLAYAQQGDPPEIILAKLSRLVRIEETEHFATVVCALLDVAGHQITVANAGHLPPLLVDRATPKFLAAGIGIPVGLSDQAAYQPIVVTVPPGASLLAFTDGLIERRGEAIDISLKRLADAVVVRADQPIDQIVAAVVEDFTRDGIDDDAAILGVEWQT